MKDPFDLVDQIVQESRAYSLSSAVQEAQLKAEIKNAAVRHQERMAKYKAWVDPDAIAERKERHALEAKAAFSSTRAALGLTGDEVLKPLPAEKDLPPHMRGQSESTVRAWMKSQWTPEPEVVRFSIEEGDFVAVPFKAVRRPWYVRLFLWLRS